MGFVDVLVGNVDAAGVANLAVNDRNLSVAAVIELAVGVALEP